MKRLPTFVFLLAFMAGNAVFFMPKISRSLNKISQLDKQIKELDLRIAGYKKEIKSYDEKTIKMKSDFYREKMGRDKHKLIKEGETIYKPAN